MFKDRRNTTERRSKNLSIPGPSDRRVAGSDGRRLRNFQSKPWWLNIDYCEELTGNSSPGATRGTAKPDTIDPLQKK
jgi:hypothetical protein